MSEAVEVIVPYRPRAAFLPFHNRTEQEAVIVAHRRMGKALDVETPIPTPSGYVRMGDLKAGDEVFDEAGFPVEVMAAHDVMHGRRCVDVCFDDGERIVCDTEHLWLTRTKADRTHRTGRYIPKRCGKRGGRGEKVNGQQAPRPGTVKTTAVIAATLLARGERNHSVPLAPAWRTGGDVFLPVPPYILGLWLGDGTHRCPHVTTLDPEIVEALQEYARETGNRCFPLPSSNAGRAKTYAISGGSNPMTTTLRKLGVLHPNPKHVPSAYLWASVAQRRALLAGLMDTDGSVDAKAGRMCELTLSDRRLIDDVRQLILSLDGKCGQIKDKIINGETYWRLTFSPKACPFRLPRKMQTFKAPKEGRQAFGQERRIIAVNEVETRPVRCITVASESSLYLCGHAGIPTHNTVAIANDGQKRALLNPRKTPPPRYAWFYPSRVRAKDIAWGYLKYFSKPIPGVRHIESELAVEYPNGARFTLYGADNARGVGLYLDGVYYDEADEIPRSTIVDVAPALSDRSGFAVYAGMLKGRHNLWKRYEESRGKPGIYTMLARASETGIIAPHELARLRETMGEAAYEMQLECNANASIANAIYGTEMDALRREGRLKTVAIEPDRPLDFFFDIGHALHGDNWSMWGAQLAGRDIMLHCYHAQTGKIPAYYAAKVLEYWRDAGCHGTVYLPHDGARKDRAGRSARDDLEAAGIRSIKIVERTPNVWDSINDVRAMFSRIYINQPLCNLPWVLGEIEMPSGVDCLDYYVKKTDEQSGLIQDVPVHNQYSHGADALRTFTEAYRLGMLEGSSAIAKEGRSAGKPNVLRGAGPQSYPGQSPRNNVRVIR